VRHICITNLVKLRLKPNCYGRKQKQTKNKTKNSVEIEAYLKPSWVLASTNKYYYPAVSELISICFVSNHNIVEQHIYTPVENTPAEVIGQSELSVLPKIFVLK
jgi:hypothetical protein